MKEVLEVVKWSLICKIGKTSGTECFDGDIAPTIYLKCHQKPAGWPDWAIFCQLGYFWRLIMIFWKDEVAQNNGNYLGYILFKQIYYICILLQFQNMICCRYFKVSKVVRCRCFGLSNWAFFDLATFWAILWKIWRIFFF